MTIPRQLAQLEGRDAARRGVPHTANPYGVAQWEQMLSWSHGWLIGRILVEDGLYIPADQ